MHTNALLRLTVSVGLVGLGSLIGCSSSSTSSTSTTAAAGGSAQTTTTGTTTTTNTTGTTTTTATGTGGAGQGGGAQGGNGSGGAGSCTGLYDSGIPACNTCLEGGCCAELAACNGDPNCAPCLSGADGCTQSGDAFNGLTACLQNTCSTECTPPAPPACNPVTGEPCDLAGGEACDLGSDGNGGSAFQCFPAPNEAKLCGACDNSAGPYCQNGFHCDTDKCAKYCCGDGDCGAGNVCDQIFLPDFQVGICHVKGAAGGGGAGGGGAGGAPAAAPACDAPADSPSKGACAVPK